MSIDESAFFREATLRICGSLEIESAMQRCLHYLSRYLPATSMSFHVYDRDLGIVETIAIATMDSCRAMSLRTPLSPRGRRQVEDQRSTRTKLMERSGDDAVAGPVVRQLGIEDQPGLLLDLALEGKFVGTLSVFSEQDITFNHHHVRLLSLLNEPCAIALTNRLRYRELQTLRDTLADDNRYLQDELRTLSGSEVIGAEFGLRRVMDMVRQVAPLKSPVLLLGETGVGKEVIANAIHNLSLRSNGPFIRVNCGAVPQTLMDSELFGHEKGAFTGALFQKRGRFERADGGTIFLDEIGDITPKLQAELLRVLDMGEVRPVGGTLSKRVDVRLIAATNKSLEDGVRDGWFREDLYYRLNVFSITMPPLRTRVESIPLLAHHFLEKARNKLNKHIVGIEERAINAMVKYPWPGNIREMQNVIERAAVLTHDDIVKLGNLPLAFAESYADEAEDVIDLRSFKKEREPHVLRVEKKLIQRYLLDAGGNVSKAAQLANIPRRTFYRLLDKHGLKGRIIRAREGEECD